MTKLDAFQKYDETTMKRMQLVYLDFYGFDPEEIAKYVDYAVSTIKTYIKKFANLLESAKKIFYHITLKTKKEIKGERQIVYLFKFYDSNNELICSKVGTTTRLVEQRLKEEIKYYRDHDIDVDHAEICSTFDCGELPAEGAESQTRAAFIKRYPKAFCKNDRFFNVDISTVVFNRIVKEYLG